MRQYFAAKPHLALTSRHLGRMQLSAFFAFCIKRGWISANPIKGLSKLKRRPPEPSYFEDHEIETLLRTLTGLN
jgi:site-specific recombinase XerD